MAAVSQVAKRTGRACVREGPCACTQAVSVFRQEALFQQEGAFFKALNRGGHKGLGKETSGNRIRLVRSRAVTFEPMSLHEVSLVTESVGLFVQGGFR